MSGSDLPDNVGQRAVLLDDGVGMVLHVYGTGREPLAVVGLTPLTAGRLGCDLLTATLRHLSRRRYCADCDSSGSYNDAIAALRERVQAGAELPADSVFRPKASEVGSPRDELDDEMPL